MQINDNKYWPYPLQTALLELTLKCNARCIHCGSSAGNPRQNELTKEEHAALIGELAELGCKEMCFLGGEPFLCEWWQTSAFEARKHGIGLVFITNGSLIDRSIVKKLKEAGNVSRIAISLDGAKAETHDFIRQRRGSFDEAVSALERLRGEGFEAGAITTVLKPNFGELYAIRDMLAGRDIPWQIQVSGNSGQRFDKNLFIDEKEFYEVGVFLDRSRKEYSVSELPVAGAHDIGYFSTCLRDYGEMPQEMWNGCVAGISSVGIMSNGGVKGCLSLPDKFTEGNVKTQSIIDIWKNPNLFERNRKFRREKLAGFCGTCEHAAKCRAGCQEMCLSSTGTVWENKYCFYRIEKSGLLKPGKK